MSGKPSTPKQQNNKPAAAGTPKGQQNPKKEQPQTPKNDQKNNKPTENKGQEKKQQQNNKPAENKGQEKKQAIVAAAKPAEKNQNQQPKKVKPTPAAEKKDEISLSPDFSDLPDTSFFAVEVDPKKALSQSLFFPVKLAQVIISPTAKDGDRSTLFAIVDDKKWPLATLTAGKVDQLPLRLTFDEGINLTFIVSGSASIFVYGNYGTSDDQDDMYDSEDDDEMAARFGGYDDSDDEDEDSDSDQGDGVSSDEEPIKPGQLKRKGTPATALIAASSSKKAKK
jgi:DNA mismatch repair ATPase MutL